MASHVPFLALSFFFSLFFSRHRQEWETRDDEEALDTTRAKTTTTTAAKTTGKTTRKPTFAERVLRKAGKARTGGVNLRRRWGSGTRARFAYLGVEARRLRRLRRQRQRLGL